MAVDFRQQRSAQTALSARKSGVLVGGVLFITACISLTACGNDGSAPDKKTDSTTNDGGTDSAVFAPKDTSGSNDASANADVTSHLDTTALPDNRSGGDTTSTATIVGVEITAAKTTLAMAERTALTITVVRTDGNKGAPTKADAVTISVDGQLQKGAGVAAAGQKQAAIAAWSFGGTYQLVGARAGTAKVVVSVNGKASPAMSLTVAWPTATGIWAAAAGVSGFTSAQRKTDLPTTVQLQGKKIGGGGLTATVRFPQSAVAGDKLDLSKPPKVGNLNLTFAFADLGGALAKPAEGVLWIDQVDKGRFRGSFLGRTTQLKPIVGVFVIERRGLFGIDLLDEPTQIAKSDNLLPTTGKHYSRVSLVATADGKAMLLARLIDSGLQAKLLRWKIDGKTGKINEIAEPFAIANAYDGKPTVKAPAFGSVIRAAHPTVIAELWEGRNGKGLTKPHRLYVHLLDGKGVEIAKPVVVSDDVCDGRCNPTIALLPSSRFLVMWSPPSGGVKVRRIKGQLAAGALEFVTDKTQVLAPKGKDGVVATLDNNVLAGWFDPDKGPVWQHFTNKSSGKLSTVSLPQPVGAVSPKTPRQSLLAIKTPTGAPNLLFISTWLDFQPGGKLSVRRIGLDGTAFGVAKSLTDVDAEMSWSHTGKDGQVAILTRSSVGQLMVRKVRFGSYKDVGTPLGKAVVMLDKASYAVKPALLYLAEADVWILAWGGDESSPGIFVRRFR